MTDFGYPYRSYGVPDPTDQPWRKPIKCKHNWKRYQAKTPEPGQNDYRCIECGHYKRSSQTLGHCHYCQVRDLMTVDHIVPRSRGGVNEQSNYVLACNDCNSRFGNRLYKCDCSLCKTAIVQHLLMLNAIMHYSPEWAKILFELFERGTTLKRGYITPNRLVEKG